LSIAIGKVSKEMDLSQDVDIIPNYQDFDTVRADEESPLLTPVNETHSEDWEFAGWGESQELNLPEPPADLLAKNRAHGAKSLGQLRATSIAGNDITSSCLYVAGICILSAKLWAPISLLLVVIVLYLFRNIYAEVVTALPLNGGCYNVLLNSTSKVIASFAACLTLISYVATAVVSADSAVYYFNNLWSGFYPHWETIILLGLFAILNLIGISESANVALGIFLMHLVTMTLLIVVCFVKLFQDPSVLAANWRDYHSDPNWAGDIFWGFSSALLGVSGFETSANYIEQQKDGVFPKTLRNMWLAVSIFNPLLSFLSLAVLPLPVAMAKENYTNLLAKMGSVAGGRWLNIVVSVDATLVLSGAVLTAYVGVNGLARRMSMDRCLPQFLMQENRLRSTNHFIIVGFFLITSSLYVIVGENVQTLAGVYTIAFLGVMALFAIGNMLVKYKRKTLPREVKSSWLATLLGLAGVIAGLTGNILFNVSYLEYFALYFSITVAIVMLMFMRIRLLKFMLHFLSKKPFFKKHLGHWIQSQIKQIWGQKMIFFSKNDDISVLNKAVLYARDNELTNWLKIVHVYRDMPPPQLANDVKTLDRIYPKTRIDLVLIKGEFTPELVHMVSENLGVPKNFMFISSPGGRFPHDLSDFGGIRLITH
jgi:amino acid transporter